jgi:hypothetical protein
MPFEPTRAGSADAGVLQTPFPESLRLEPLMLEAPAGPSAAAFSSPFVSEYGSEGHEADTGERELAAALLGELYDREFEDAIGELAQEAAELRVGHLHELSETGAGRTLASEALVAEYLVPVEREAHRLFDALAEAAPSEDPGHLSDSEIDRLFASFVPDRHSLTPVQDDFIGGLARKAKAAVKGAVNAAKRGVAAVSKVLPIGQLLARLKGLVRPLLQRVLSVALNRLPAAVRPMAAKLAKRFLGEVGTEGMLEETGETAGVAEVQEELDEEIARLVLARGEVEQELVIAEAASHAQVATPAITEELAIARARFIKEITELEAGEDVEPVIERFVPAILPALRIGLRIAGRPRVVNFLAQHVAGFIQPYVGKEHSPALARALVDTGLKLLSLEAPEYSEAQATGATLAAIVEETVRGVGELAEEVDGEFAADDPLLQAFVIEAFEHAAAAHFPDALVRSELREAADGGAWVSMPIGGARQYEKYSTVFDTTVTPQMAREIDTFGGGDLEVFLQEELELDLPISARVHLYETIAGQPWLATVAAQEREVSGLGSTRRGWSRLHPLTPKAAGLLLQQPGLGRRVPARFRSTAHRIAPGQRLFYLEIPAASTTAARRRVSAVNAVLDFPGDQIRVHLYLSERTAQGIATLLRKRAPVAAVISRIRRVYERGLRSALDGQFERHVTIVHEAVPADERAGKALRRINPIVRDQLFRLLSRWLGTAIAGLVEERRQEVVEVTEAPADGITLLTTFTQPPGFAALRRILSGSGGGLAGLFSPAAAPRTDIKVLPGHHDG